MAAQSAPVAGKSQPQGEGAPKEAAGGQDTSGQGDATQAGGKQGEAAGAQLAKAAKAELAEARQYAVQKFAADLLGVGDNLARALSAPEGNEKALREGVALTATQMATTLGRHGVQEVPVKAGAPLDANTMQAMNEVPHAEIAAGHVVQALQAGFTLHGRLLRPALVVVSGGAEQADKPVLN
jgi:molecular chaperone GrpE